VPETIVFQTKPEIAREQNKAARTAGLPQGVVQMDAGYGNDTRLRMEISTLGMSYVAGSGPNTSVWPWGRGLCRRLAGASGDRPSCFDAISSRQSGKPILGWLASPGGHSIGSHSSARGSVSKLSRCAGRTSLPRKARGEPICGALAPRNRFQLCEIITRSRQRRSPSACRQKRGRWRIERDYQELKQELGLGASILLVLPCLDRPPIGGEAEIGSTIKSADDSPKGWIGQLLATHVTAGLEPVNGGLFYSVPRLCEALAAAGAETTLLSVTEKESGQRAFYHNIIIAASSGTTHAFQASSGKSIPLGMIIGDCGIGFLHRLLLLVQYGYMITSCTPWLGFTAFGHRLLARIFSEIGRSSS
jgi:hypothetical protein